MRHQDNKIHFRNTLYFKMIVVILFLGIVFFGALFCIYKTSCYRFGEELAYHSDTLTEQICRNVEVSLKELAENTMPLTATNEKLSPILVQAGENKQKPNPFLRPRMHYYLEEIINMNYDINWVAVIDREKNVYQARRVSRSAVFMPDDNELLTLYLANEKNLEGRHGNTVWSSSSNPDGVILMRLVFDSDTMKFCGCVMAEVQNSAIRKVFENIDSKRAGNFTLYDRNGLVIYSTDSSVLEGDLWKTAEKEETRGELLQIEYPINNGKLKIVHVVDMKEKNQRFSDLLRLVSGIGLLVFMAVILILWLMFGNMARNMKILLENLRRVSEGEFELESTSFAKNDELDVVARNIGEMSVRIEKLMEQTVKDQEIQQKNRYALLEAKYYGLQAQVNPHLLFNILQSINGIAQINGDSQVSRLICMLSKFFRGNIDRRDSFCELREELEYAENYLELYRGIYPDRLDIRWEVDKALVNVRIPTFILQPIVENSLVHGMEPMIGICTIRISVSPKEGKLVISVWDNGQGIEPERLKELREGKAASKRVGLHNVQDRIQLLYGQEYGLSIRSEYHRYTEVEILLPLP